MRVVPITENGEEKFYTTDASIEVLTNSFYESQSINELIQIIEDKGYTIEEYKPSIKLNFDGK